MLRVIHRIMLLVTLSLSILLVRPFLNLIIPESYFITVETQVDAEGNPVQLLVSDGTELVAPQVSIYREIWRPFISHRIIRIKRVSDNFGMCSASLHDIPSQKDPKSLRTYSLDRWMGGQYWKCRLSPGLYVMTTEMRIPWVFGSSPSFTWTSNAFTIYATPTEDH